ncbi:Protein of unknown function (DUF687) [Chlamydia serpentis]|uniref:Transmembrane protein n=1 Tax=Chlamydia serpentis TaxID=1967782 RepID=A0A2R8FAQ6_9CHLA|nr:DUF687 family protein [Chlamydia serpentis]SPN73518.1 Protein of unknown function (DUF687) [Chlamydia serpentis]
MTAPTQSRSSSPTNEDIELQPLDSSSSEPSAQSLLTISPSSDNLNTVSLSEGVTELMIEGGPRGQPSPPPNNTIYEVLCVAGEEDSDVSDSSVNILYVNGSWQTQLEAVNEALHISEVRGGPHVRLFYNDGSGMSCGPWTNPCCRSLPLISHPLCQAILGLWEQFFSYPGNQGKNFLVFFFGDGGAYLQSALDHSPYASRILIVGISPTIFIQGNYAVHNYRVAGDFFSSFDVRGTQAENTTTLPYSSGLEGYFCPSIRCPSFTQALRWGEQCLISSRVENSGGEGSSSGAPLTTPQNVAVVIDPNDSHAMERLGQWLEQGPPAADFEMNPYPQSCTAVCLSSLFAVSRVLGLTQEYLLASVHEGLDLQICYSLILMHTACAIRYFFLLFTNYPCLRERCRIARVIAQACFLPSMLVLVFDYFNLLRRLWMPYPILRAVFISASTMTGSIIFIELTRLWGRSLRGRVQQFIYRRTTGVRLPEGRVRVVNRNALGFALGFLYTAWGSIYFPLSIIVLNNIGLQIPRVLVRSNVSAVYDLENKTPQQNWQSGDVLAVGQTMNLVLTAFIFCLNIWFFIKSVLRYCRRGRR